MFPPRIMLYAPRIMMFLPRIMKFAPRIMMFPPRIMLYAPRIPLRPLNQRFIYSHKAVEAFHTTGSGSVGAEMCEDFH